mgnify:CR=1 FL=1
MCSGRMQPGFVFKAFEKGADGVLVSGCHFGDCHYIFGNERAVEQFEKTKVMAANQGLYNGFLAAGLIWSLLISDAEWSKNVALFFLACVLVAGVYGALTASKRIFFVQAVPAILGLLSLLF